jgi:hypothetical protein
MRTKLLPPVALVGVTAMGAFAASGIGSATSERSDLAGDRAESWLDQQMLAPIPRTSVRLDSLAA